MEYRKIKDQEIYDAASQDDIGNLHAKPLSSVVTNSMPSSIGGSKKSSWKLNCYTCINNADKFTGNTDCVIQKSWKVRIQRDNSKLFGARNSAVETLKCALSLAALARIWKSQGVTEDNKLSTSFNEVSVHPIPAILYLVKNLLQVMALLSGFAGLYTEAIIKKHPSRNINVQNFRLYIFGMVFNLIAICIQDYDEVMNKGFFHGYSFITVCMILNHALSGIDVSMVMKYANNIVKVYSTSVAMLLAAVVLVFLFGLHLSLAFFLGLT